MQALLRNDFKWHECTFDVATTKIKLAENNNIIAETNIVAIKDNEISKYVKCSSCGEIVLNNKKSIAKHAAKKCDSQACLTCRYLSSRTQRSSDKKYIPLDNGTYKIKQDIVVSLHCNMNYRGHEITTSEARAICKYRHCTENKDNFIHLNNFFGTNPDAFDDLVTVDALDEKIWSLESKYNDEFCFKAKKKFTLRADVNDRGIITKFRYQKRYDYWDFVYSKKYNKIFWFNGSNYSLTPPRYIESTRIDEIKKIVENIYNYEVKK